MPLVHYIINAEAAQVAKISEKKPFFSIIMASIVCKSHAFFNRMQYRLVPLLQHKKRGCADKHIPNLSFHYVCTNYFAESAAAESAGAAFAVSTCAIESESLLPALLAVLS